MNKSLEEALEESGKAAALYQDRWFVLIKTTPERYYECSVQGTFVDEERLKNFLIRNFIPLNALNFGPTEQKEYGIRLKVLFKDQKPTSYREIESALFGHISPENFHFDTNETNTHAIRLLTETPFKEILRVKTLLEEAGFTIE